METKKQEAIRLAYGEYWESVKNKKFYDGWAVVENKEEFNRDLFDYTYFGNLEAIRPKSLQGIETNNGFIKIMPDGNNLPKDDDFCFVVIQGLVSVKQYHLLQYKFWKEHVTHYQPIKKPNPPIF